MTKRPKPKPNKNGGWDKNMAMAKSGFNKAILDKGWGQFATYIGYKSQQAGKAYFKVDAKYTSQECAACNHTHPENRKSQSLFICDKCGNKDNADRNAALVIKMRAIKLILNSGTELSKQGVLTPSKDKGRGTETKTQEGKAFCAFGSESPKKKIQVTKSSLVA